MSDKICRWGILSSASIAQKNWQAINNTGNATIIAVASRDVARAQQFIDECQANVPFQQKPEALGSYDELIARDDIDAVYVPLPTGLRKEWVIKAAEAGKHVMCEKPCAPNLPDLEEMVAACKANNVQFMDGVMFMHSKRLQAVREVLDDGESIGEIRRICSQFSFRAPDDFLAGNIRVHSSLEPHGCLGDLGWYTTRFILWTMNYQLPERVSARILSQFGREGSPNSVPMEFSAELFYPNGVSANYYCSFLTENQQWVHVSGTKGFLNVPFFVLPNFSHECEFEVTNADFAVDACQFNMKVRNRRVAADEFSNNAPNAQETNLFRNFSAIVNSGQLEDTWPDIALKTQRIMEAALESARADGKMVEIS